MPNDTYLYNYMDFYVGSVYTFVHWKKLDCYFAEISVLSNLRLEQNLCQSRYMYIKK